MMMQDGTKIAAKDMLAASTIPAEQRIAHTVPNVVIVAVVYESDSFSGQRHDGFCYMPNNESYQAFKAHLQKHKSRESYCFMTDVNLLSIEDAGLEAMIAAVAERPDRPWLWVDTDYAVCAWYD
ncbi:hypothetical protein YOLOSWAG_306 [Erwinia phage vB_EamM_Yoloswag]|uniref:Uncharacterized protein n=1 Tax=Erwinia phage vB_EamM_Yoloswag TaxID=1958956 RepID=A0A1S6L3M3_9CAUD|nr:hypothetical protein HOR66_gp306 [Erwinia phage vB_EamM_Yoloswag]AQT28776.1 hypothetical protein YOLOSWAG_306 [Erwinia phage vB_EamM_Yoloswag]